MKKYYPYFHFVLLTIVLGFSSLQAIAQQTFPVVARFTQLPPYPVYLADFSNPSQTNLSIQVQQNDATIASRPFKIRIYIEGNGFLIESTDMVQGEPPLTLAFGQIYNLPAAQVANYFKQYNLKVTPAQYSRPFNEGTFRFGVQIIDFQTNRNLSGIQWANPVWITINEPPVWVMPQASKTSIIPTTPQNITFQWAPRHTNVNDVEYEFTITEIITPQGFQGNIQNLFLAQPAFYKTRLRNLTLNYNITLPPLVEGRTYAYRVQAIAKRGLEDVGVFRNNGFSEIQSFKYGEPVPDVKPPTNLKITRNETGTGANFDWKGEPDHKNFTIEYREKGSQGTWATANVKATAGNVYNNYFIPKLDEKKNYELRVVGINEGNKSATSVPITLETVANTLKKEPEIAIQGVVQWAYFASEEKVKENAKIIDVATNSTLPARDIKHGTFEQQKGSRKHPLENAIVTLFSSEDASITTQNYKEKIGTGIIKKIETVSSDASGQFKFKATNIKLLADVKNLYILATYKDFGVFNYEIVKVSIAANATETQTLEPITVLANSLRFSPKILVEQTAVTTTKVEQRQKFIPWRMVTEEVRVPTTGMAPIEGNLTLDNVEEIALYRLQSTIDKNPYLKNEGNVDGNRTTIKFNNDTYVKVADFKNTTTSAQLFYNKAYNDSFVLRIKQKERDEVIYPVNNIEAFQEAKYASITDYFKYTPPTVKIKGYVERKSKDKTERMANVAVQAMGATFRTNANGYFETEIPKTQTKGSKIILLAADPLNVANKVVDTITYNLENITRTLVFKEGAHYVSSAVYDGYTRKPLGGAMVTYNGTTVKTDSSGVFRFVVDGDKMVGSIKVVATGYTEQELDTKVLKTTLIGGSNTAEKKTDWLKSIGLKFKNEKESSAFFADNYTKLERQPSANFIKDSVLVNSVATFRILTYTEKRGKLGFRNLSDSADYVASVLKINDGEKNVSKGGYKRVQYKPKESFGGYIDKTAEKKIKVQVVNKDTTKLMYAEEEFTFTLPSKVKKDSVYTFAVRLKPAKYLHGIVFDSTMFIANVHSEDNKNVNRPGKDLIVLEEAKVSIENAGDATTDKRGYFRILVPEDQELSVEVTKKGYAKTKTTVTKWNPDADKTTADKKSRQPFYIVQFDSTQVPNFKTLLGFDIVLERAVINSTKKNSISDKADVATVKTYLISGKIKLTTGKAKNANIFTADKTKELTFKNLVVKSQNEAKNKDNAVTLLTSVNLIETEAEIKLFGYAPITLKGNHAGEPFIRLQHLLGKEGEGKIGASELDFTQQTILGIKFGDMELKIKEPEKEKGFGKFDDKVSKEKGKSELYKEQTALEKELATKKDDDKAAKAKAQKEAAENAAATLKALQASQKAVNKEGTAADKKTMSEIVATQKKEADDKKYAADGATKIPDKEPLMLAFATSELEELRDDKEFSIVFDKQTNKEKNGDKKNKDGTEKTGLEVSDDHIKFALGSVNLSSLGVGTVKTAVPGKSFISVHIEKASAVLKKSGISMKGNIEFPQIWKFKTDKPLIIEKLDIDKSFGLKQVNFAKGDKGAIYEFGMANSWMFYINNFQIYNNFKGYGIGGTFNTDKENYLNVKSLGLTVSGGKVYPNVEINTPEQGIRFSNLRFKTMGKKSISYKGTPADDSYEIEASLRIEWDESEVKYSNTDSTDRFGKKLSEEQMLRNKVDAENKNLASGQATAQANREAKKNQINEEELLKEIEQRRVALSKEEDELGKAEQNLVAKRAAHMKSPNKSALEQADFKEKEAKLTVEIADLKTKRTNLDARWSKWGDDKAAKEKEIEKLKEDAKKPAGGGTAVASAEPAKKEEPKKDDAKKGGLNWKERLFPINLQVFQWSTAGKLLVSAAPSEKALDFGPVNFKIRRIVYTKARSKDGQVKLSAINDLLKLTEEEAAKLNSTTNFNDANMAIADGKREGVLSKDTQKGREGVSSGNLTVKALSDKVAAEDPKGSWAMGFAGGIELTSTVKGLKFDSDVSMIVGDFGNGTEFKMNEIMLKLDGTGYRVMGKVKLATSGKKIGFEGSVDFETVKRKFAASFKYYKVDGGIELGAAIQASTLIPMGSITWTSIGGGFDFNTADQKYKVFFLGSAITTGTSEKVVAYKSVTVSVEFDGKTCGAAPVIKGTMDLWSNDEEFGKASVELDFCKMRVIAKVSAKKELAKTMVQLNALVVISKAGFFAGAMAEAEILGFKANGIIAIGAVCNTSSPDMPTELSAYVQKLPRYLFQNDNVTFSGIYIGFEIGKEMKDEGSYSLKGFKLASYKVEMKIKGAASIGVNFSNGNFMLKSMLDMNLEARATLLAMTINGNLKLFLNLEGGRTNDMGWNFIAQTRGNLEVYNDEGKNIACNDWSLERPYHWADECAERRGSCWCRWPYGCIRTERRWVRQTWAIPELKFKVCLNWNFGVGYRQLGPENGWKFIK